MIREQPRQGSLEPVPRHVDADVRHPVKAPWYIDLLNLNLDNHDLGRAERRIAAYFAAFDKDGTRLTENLDFGL